MRRLFCVSAFIVGCLCSSALAAVSLGSFELTDVGGGRYDVVLTLDPKHAAVDVPGRVEREESLPPVYVRMLEVGGGRSVAIDHESVTVRYGPVDPDADWAPVDEEVVLAEVARMRGRVFLRVEVRPYRYDAAAGAWQLARSIAVSVQVSDEPPPTDVSTRAAAIRSLSAAPCVDCPPFMPLYVSEGSGGTPPEFLPHRSVTNAEAWKITVSSPGLYRITGADLASAGVPVALRDASRLQVRVRDRVLPVWRSTSGSMAAHDYIMFYGTRLAGNSGTGNVYWVAAGDASPLMSVTNVAPVSGYPLVTSAWHSLVYNPKRLYKAAYRPLAEDFDHWFAMSVLGNTTSNILFGTPNPVFTGNAYLAYSLHGQGTYASVNPSHRSVLRASAVAVSTNDYYGEVPVSGEASFPASLLRTGITTVSVQQVLLPGIPIGHAPSVSAYVESLQLCYQRRLVVSTYPFFFSTPDGQANVRLTGFGTNAAPVLLDVTDPFAPRELTGFEYGSDALRLASEAGGRCLALFNAASIKPVPPLVHVRFRDLSSANQAADYLAVTASEFRRDVYRLLKHRYKNGLSVQVATVDDVYHEFSYGIPDPVGLRQYFGYAYHHYAAPPLYALLVGTGSYDPQNHLGFNRVEHIPVRMGGAPFLQTAREQWFVTVDGPDFLPDIRLGRMAITNTVSLSNAVRKIIAFETAPTHAFWRENALLVADRVDGTTNFKAHVDGVTRPQLVTGGFHPVLGIHKAYLDDAVDSETAGGIVRSNLSYGVHFVHYMGHGGVSQWSVPSIWNQSDAWNSVNQFYPVFAVFTCQVGAFHEPDRVSLVEAIIGSRGAGSSAFAPSALSVQARGEYLANGFYQALAIDRVETLGEAAERAFLSLYGFNTSAAELQFYTIFGDPALRLWGGATP